MSIICIFMYFSVYLEKYQKKIRRKRKKLFNFKNKKRGNRGLQNATQGQSKYSQSTEHMNSSVDIFA